jgi:hypothetical protein
MHARDIEPSTTRTKPLLTQLLYNAHAGIIGYSLVHFVGCPAPLAVLIGGVCGVIGWAANMI